MLKIRAGASKKVGCTRWRNMLTGWRIDGVTRVLSGFSVPYSSDFNVIKSAVQTYSSACQLVTSLTKNSVNGTGIA